MAEKELPIKELSGQAAKMHADSVSICQDLKYVLWAIKKARKLRDENSDWKDVYAYWSSALIAYRRCFNTGKRFGLVKEMYQSLPGDPVGAHEYFYELANKLVAHSVNPFEKVSVGVVIKDSAVIGVSESSMQLVSTSEEGYKTLHGLTLFAAKQMEKSITQSRNKLESMALKLPKKQLDELKPLKHVAPGPDDAGKARKD